MSDQPPKKQHHLQTCTPERNQEIARMGGQAVSADRAHMSEIGRRGGLKASQDRAKMAEIGRKGGLASRGRLKTDGKA